MADTPRITRPARIMVAIDPDAAVPTLNPVDDTSRVSVAPPSEPVLPPTGEMAAGSAVWSYDVERNETRGRPAVVTVRLRPDPMDASASSDGVPREVETELSSALRPGQIEGPALELRPADVWKILMYLVDLARLHGQGDIVESPLLSPERGAQILVLRWKAFNRWLASLESHPVPFAELRAICARSGPRVRDGSVGLARMIRRLAAEIREHDGSDNPHFMLDVSGMLERERYRAAELEINQELRESSPDLRQALINPIEIACPACAAAAGQPCSSVENGPLSCSARYREMERRRSEGLYDDDAKRPR